jgi:hypothetical protein
MQVSVSINLAFDESAADLSGNATELAEKILVAIGGDASKDIVGVNIFDSGSVGTTPSLPPIPEPPPTQ